MDNGLTNREAGELLADVKYLKVCCDEVKKDIDSSKTRSTATLTTVIILLIGVVVNLAITLSK
jgi:uncharacterized Rmd1/YagE family protein